MLRPLTPEDPIIEAPGLHNAYPIANEISGTGSSLQHTAFPENSDTLYIDDTYGRIYSSELIDSHSVYGKSDKLNYHLNIDGLKLVDELRVPFRKIPIYAVDKFLDIEPYIKSITRENPSHKILLRGQAKTYLIERPQIEFNALYGGHVKEPSFLPSHLRANFDEHFLKSLWHSISSILLNKACIEKTSENSENAEELKFDAHKVRHTPLFNLFALGIAQHYGLPSVGLDLTDNLTVASWFALNRIAIDSQGIAISSPVTETTEPTIFIFRCPQDAVYNYEFVRPKILDSGRPVSQHAWFGHVGWGEAKNQLGSYLVCGFRLHPDNVGDLPKDHWRHLFPDSKDDYILDFFKKMKERNCYLGEAKRALDRLYLFQH